MNNLFRKNSMDQVSSPEQLNDYIRVSTPSVWILLCAIVLLLAGVCTWGIFGRMETEIASVTVSENGVVTCYFSENDFSKVKPGMNVSLGDTEGVILSISKEPIKAGSALTEYMCHLGGFTFDQWVYEAVCDVTCPEGVYRSSIVTESISPMSFILN